MKGAVIPKGKDKAVGVVIGALLLTVILFAFLTAYILYYVPSTEQTNASSSITDRENGFIGLTQSINNAQHVGSYVSQVVPLGYSGVPPFSQPSSSSISYQNNTSLFLGYLNYTFNVTLANSSLGETLNPNEIAVLPISIYVPANEPKFFNIELSIDSNAYSAYESANLTNILFMYQNGTVIPSWLENNASSTASSSIYWLKLNGVSSGTTITADMVFLPVDINIMNKYQTGEAPQCSPLYGEYNDIANVLSPGLEYQIYYDSSGNFDSQGYQNDLYNANMANDTSITEKTASFNSNTLPFNTSLVGVKCSVNGNNKNNVIINYQYGYTGGKSYPKPPVTTPKNSFLIKMLGFAEINSTSTVIHGATDDGMAVGMAVGYNSFSGFMNGVNWLGVKSNPNNLINKYFPQSCTIYKGQCNAKNGTYPIEMDYFQDGGYAYTALWSNYPITYYHPVFPAGGLVPSVTLGKLSLDKIATVPITITNTQDQAEPHTYQQNISVNNALYSKYEAGSLQNIIFTYQNGTVIPSWLQSGNTNTSSSSVYWLSMYGMPALASEKIYMVLLPKYMDMMNNFRTGENPSLSSVYGEYDDGSSVFVDYYSGSSLSKWNHVGASGLISTAPSGSPGGIEAFYAASANGDYLDTNASYNQSSDYIIQYYVYTTGLGDFFFSSSASGHGQMSRLDSRSGCSDLGLAATSSWTSWNAPIDHATLSSYKWYLFSVIIANGKIADYQNTNLNVYSNLGVNINPLSSTYQDSAGGESYSPLGSYIGLVGDALGSSYDTYWNGIIIRDYPANGVMPSVIFANANTSSTNTSILHFTENYKIYGSLDSVLNIGNTNAGTIYLADGSTVLSYGNENVIRSNVIRSILPVNLTESNSGVGISVNAVSIIGKNQTDSAIGSSIVKLVASNVQTTTYYKGEVLSLLSPSFVPYTADVSSINISSFSYVISGPLGEGFNNSLYEIYGNGQAVGSNHTWFIDNNLSVTYNNELLKIGMLGNSLQVNSLSIEYKVYSLLNI
ncbi:MAG: hypothetical protein AAE987_02680 [Thermoplasmataceae archaeon]